MDRNKPLAILTVGDLMEIVDYIILKYNPQATKSTEPLSSQKPSVESVEPSKELIYGLAGLMNLLSVSKSTAYRIKRSGILDDCTYQIGRTIVFDKNKVIEKLSCSNQLPWSKSN